jgi:transcriptional regulator with XRE-family HTH domain/predicted RNase H-like HicB family nuclease
MEYPAIITKEGDFTLAEFPDCEGCQTYARKGESIEEAAAEALELWLDANLGRDSVPNRPGTIRISRDTAVIRIPVPVSLAFRLELRWAREESGKSQAEFGKSLNMSQQQYAKLEAPNANPTLKTVERVAKVAGLGVSVIKVSEPRGTYTVTKTRNVLSHPTKSKERAAGVLRSTPESKLHKGRTLKK